MIHYETLYTFILATMALAISPGPDNMYVLMQSLVNGRKYGLATTAGLISGCLVHTTLLAFGVSIIIKERETLFFSIKLLGSAYLFYLAYRVFKSSTSLEMTKGAVPLKSPWRLYKQGFVMNVLNPKVTLFFLAFFPGFLFSEKMNVTVQFYMLGFLFMAVSFVIFSLIALLSGSLSSVMKNNVKIGFYLKWLQIMVFIGIALFILVSDN